MLYTIPGAADATSSAKVSFRHRHEEPRSMILPDQTAGRRMLPFFRALPLVALALAAPLAVVAQRAQLPPPLELRVPKPPTFASGDGGSFLAYELHITNLSSGTIRLRRVDVMSADSGGHVLLTLADSLLSGALGRPGLSPAPAPAERTQLGGGLRAVVFLWIPLDARTTPGRLRHRLSVSRGTSDTASTIVVEGETVATTPHTSTIGPPLRGGGWLAANGPDPITGHRRALVTLDGIPAIAQRFAIDYLKLNDTASSFSGDRANNASYLAEGAEAIAVADGTVTSTKDGIPENVPGIDSRAVPITLETIGGNFVVIDIGQGRYAFYAHFKPGSLRVKPGDQVRRGQVLGLVGNSGNSTEPHLHFHISDGPSPLGSQGLPYTIDTFQLEGRCTPLVGCKRNAPLELRRREMPMANMIVRFPN